MLVLTMTPQLITGACWELRRLIGVPPTNILRSSRTVAGRNGCFVTRNVPLE